MTPRNRYHAASLSNRPSKGVLVTTYRNTLLNNVLVRNKRAFSFGIAVRHFFIYFFNSLPFFIYFLIFLIKIKSPAHSPYCVYFFFFIHLVHSAFCK